MAQHGTQIREVNTRLEQRLRRLHRIGAITLPNRKTMAHFRPIRGRGRTLADAVVEDRDDRF